MMARFDRNVDSQATRATLLLRIRRDGAALEVAWPASYRL